MDGEASYPLVAVPVPPEEAPVPVVAETCEDFPQADSAAWSWERLCELAVLFLLAMVTLRRLRWQVVDLRWQANYWRAQHQRAVEREAALAEEVQRLQGEIRELKRRFYGRKSETSATTNPQGSPKNPGKPRKRGQQPGSKGHGRRHHDHLPTTHVDCPLPDSQKCCPNCGEPLEEIPGTADGDILEIDVRAHRRRYHRRRYRRH
jgi:transposase